jgi:hypothetical protein
MSITEEDLEAFLNCETKSYLTFNGVVGVPSEFAQSRKHLREMYRQTCREQLFSVVRDGEWHAGTPDLQSLKSNRYLLIVDYVVAVTEIYARLDALVRIRCAGIATECPYCPIRFVPGEKLTTHDKLLLAFDALAFSKVRELYSRLAGRSSRICPTAGCD